MTPIVSQAASLALYGAALAIAACATPARGFRLVAALFALVFGVGCLNVLIEGVAFGVLGTSEAMRAFALMSVEFAALAVSAAVVTSKLLGTAGGPEVTLKLTPLRVCGVALAYVVLYLAAGMAIYPYVREFYAGRHLPALSTVVGVQVVRGLIYLLSAIPLLRLNLRRSWLVLGVAFPLIAGLAPLVADNPLMPAQIRAAHAVEITISNCLFGVVLAWLIVPRAQEPRRTS